MGGNSSVRETREGNTARTGLWCHRVRPMSEDRTGHIRGHSVCVPCPRQDQPHWLCLQKLLVIRVAVRSRSLQPPATLLPSFRPSLPAFPVRARLHRKKPLEYGNHHALVTDFQARR